MRRWNASMPRKASTKPGNAYVVLAFKRDTGARMEFEGQLANEDADTLMKTAIEMMKKNKDNHDQQ